MSMMQSTMQSTIRTVKQLASPKVLIKSTWLFGLTTLFLAMYGPRLHPKLPSGLRNLFNNPIFNGLVIFLVIYMANRDMATALVITVVFIVTLNLLNSDDILNDLRNLLASNESFVNEGKEVKQTHFE